MTYRTLTEVWHRPGEIFPSQGKYVVKLLERFGMVDSKIVSTLMELKFKKLFGNPIRPMMENPTKYRQLMGALMFLVKSRPVVCFEISLGHNQP